MTHDSRDVDLAGLIDMHIHTAPDVRPRRLDDVEAARQAAEAGMRAIVLKSHVTCTADRASMAQEVVLGANVFGGVALNDAVGGLNPAAVDAALRLGGRIVWMPTISARNGMMKHDGTSGGISLLTPDGQVQSALYDIFDLIVQYDAILATGHVSVREIVSLVQAASSAGVRKLVVTHPEVPWIDMPASIQTELRDLGACFERCYVSTMPEGDAVPLARIVSDIREVGVESTVMATDFGLAELPSPVDGMRTYIARLLGASFSEKDIWTMSADTPARLLGLD